jgi:hypothetical protein
MMPKGAVAADTNTSWAGISSKLQDTRRPSHEQHTTHNYRIGAAVALIIVVTTSSITTAIGEPAGTQQLTVAAQ